MKCESSGNVNLEPESDARDLQGTQVGRVFHFAAEDRRDGLRRAQQRPADVHERFDVICNPFWTASGSISVSDAIF